MIYIVYVLCNGYMDWKQIPVELSWTLGWGVEVTSVRLHQYHSSC